MTEKTTMCFWNVNWVRLQSCSSKNPFSWCLQCFLNCAVKFCNVSMLVPDPKMG